MPPNINQLVLTWRITYSSLVKAVADIIPISSRTRTSAALILALVFSSRTSSVFSFVYRLSASPAQWCTVVPPSRIAAIPVDAVTATSFPFSLNALIILLNSSLIRLFFSKMRRKSLIQ